ncbi:tetratricopeptide repeat protein [Ghiorsea bivora]|uniref:tetratricopeptide repeat protein n=1 Tax=Ghiorsea bivora TaxID=1485545 RepID=UPI00056F3C05|nr:tetratricopeptide repeat protein [Ghiorsea bivora]
MNNRFFPLVALLLLASCANTVKHTNDAVANKSLAQTKPKQHVAMPLERMDASFLYLAYQQSMQQGQLGLATRFLKALIKKDPHTFSLKIELVNLYLNSGRVDQVAEALQVMESVSTADIQSLSAQELSDYQLLYARVLMLNGQQQQAVLLLKNLLQTQPKNIQVRLLLVRMYARQGKFQYAHGLLKEGIKLVPDVRLYEAQVQLFVQQKDYKAADKKLQSMQVKYPDHEDVVLKRSQLAEQVGDVLKAEKLLQAYIDKHGADAVQSFSMLANLYVRQDRLKEAVIMFKHLIPLTANAGSVYMSLGKVYYQLAEFEKASETFAQAVQKFTPQAPKKRISDTQAAAYFYWAASLEALGQDKEAVLAYKKLKSYHTFYVDAQLRLASMAIAKDEFQAAETRLLKLLKSNPKHVAVYEMLSNLRLQQKAYAKLLEETEPALALAFSPVLLFNRAIALEARKDFKHLDETLSLLLEQDPNHAEALNFYGYSLADRGVRLDDALLMVQKALKQKPQDGYYLDSLAWVYFKQGKYQQAVDVQRKAVVLVPDDAVMQEHLGDMFWKAGQHDAARERWQKALELKHDNPSDVQGKIRHGLM